MTGQTEHRWAVDSVADGVARIEEDGDRMISIPAHLLPDGVKEGGLLRVVRGPGPSVDSVVLAISVDDRGASIARAASEEAARSAMAKSRNHDHGGDVAL